MISLTIRFALIHAYNKEVSSFLCPAYSTDSNVSWPSHLIKLSIKDLKLVLRSGQSKILFCFFLFRVLEDQSSPQCCFRDQQFWMAIKVMLPNKCFFESTCAPHVAFPIKVIRFFPGCCLLISCFVFTLATR